MQRIWDIQGFSGGESDDAFRGAKDTFWSAENVEVRKNLSGAYLANGLQDTGWTISGDVVAMVNLETIGAGSGIVVCTNTGRIYLNGTLMTTLVDGTQPYNRIRGIGTMVVSGTQYLYYFTDTFFGNGQIHRSPTDLSSFNLAYRTYTTSAGTSASNVTVLKKAGDLLFHKNNKVMRLSSIEVVDDRLELPSTEVIVRMTQFQNNYKVYSNSQSTGVQYVWDGDNTTPDYRQEWVNQPVLGVTNDGAYDYAILGFNSSYSDLYLISGTQKQELRVNLESASWSRVFAGDISIREAIVYISGGQTGESGNYGVYTYGNYYPGTSKSLVQSYSKTSPFTVHAHSATSSYFACTDGKIYTVECNAVPINGYAQSGFITTQMYQGNIWENKRLDSIQIGYKLEAETQVLVYLRTNFLGSWRLVKTIAGSQYQDVKGCKITGQEIGASGLIGNFNEIQMKIELIAGNSGGPNRQTPYVFRATAYMDVVTT